LITSRHLRRIDGWKERGQEVIESGKLTMDDVKEAEKALRKLERKDKS
jgi:hypothetical protein